MTRRKRAWRDPDDAPELTDEWFDRAEYRIGDKLVRRGRPTLGTPKRPARRRKKLSPPRG